MLIITDRIIDRITEKTDLIHDHWKTEQRFNVYYMVASIELKLSPYASYTDDGLGINYTSWCNTGDPNSAYAGWFRQEPHTSKVTAYSVYQFDTTGRAEPIEKWNDVYHLTLRYEDHPHVTGYVGYLMLDSEQEAQSAIDLLSQSGDLINSEIRYMERSGLYRAFVGSKRQKTLKAVGFDGINKTRIPKSGPIHRR